MFEVKVESSFSAAHHLLNYKGACENQHGHNWKVEVYVRGENLNESGILIDFKVLKKKLNEVIDYLDHTDINELPEFQGVSTSSENISKYIYSELKKEFLGISKVCVWETPTSRASYWE